MFFKFHIKDKEMTVTIVSLFSKIELFTLGIERDKCSNNERGNSRGHVTISMCKESMFNI